VVLATRVWEAHAAQIQALELATLAQCQNRAGLGPSVAGRKRGEERGRQREKEGERERDRDREVKSCESFVDQGDRCRKRTIFGLQRAFVFAFKTYTPRISP